RGARHLSGRAGAHAERRRARLPRCAARLHDAGEPQGVSFADARVLDGSRACDPRRAAARQPRAGAAPGVVTVQIRGSGRFDLAAEGTFTKASPSSTISWPTLHVQVSRARCRSGMSSATVTVTSTWSPIRTGAWKLSVCDT